MNFYLLDAGGAGLVYFFYGLLIGFMILCILVEAGIMLAMKYNTKFKKTLLDSFLVNMASLVVGFILVFYVDDSFNSYEILNMLALYVVTVVIEAVLLYLLNKQQPVRKTILVAVVMNAPTYLVLYLIGNNG